MSDKVTLLDKKDLSERHPAFKNRWTIEWLIRKRRIPFVRIGKKIYFEEGAISEWISKKSHYTKIGKEGDGDD